MEELFLQGREGGWVGGVSLLVGKKEALSWLTNNDHKTEAFGGGISPLPYCWCQSSLSGSILALV